MLTTFTRLMEQAKVTRTGGMTYDNRSTAELLRQLQAEVEALRRHVRMLEGKR